MLHVVDVPIDMAHALDQLGLVVMMRLVHDGCERLVIVRRHLGHLVTQRAAESQACAATRRRE